MIAPTLSWGDLLDPLAAGERTLEPAHDLPHLDLLPKTLRDAAVLVPLVPGQAGLEIILTRRTEKLRHHAGQISFPGGSVEAGDARRLDTALREAREEIGLAPGQVTPVGCLAPVMTITGFAMVPFVGLVEANVLLQACPHEVDEVFQVPLEHVLDSANHEARQSMFRGRMREYHVIQYHDYMIWGATAAVLIDLSQRVSRDRGLPATALDG